MDKITKGKKWKNHKDTMLNGLVKLLLGKLQRYKNVNRKSSTHQFIAMEFYINFSVTHWDFPLYLRKNHQTSENIENIRLARLLELSFLLLHSKEPSPLIHYYFPFTVYLWTMTEIFWDWTRMDLSKININSIFSLTTLSAVNVCPHLLEENSWRGFYPCLFLIHKISINGACSFLRVWELSKHGKLLRELRSSRLLGEGIILQLSWCYGGSWRRNEQKFNYPFPCTSVFCTSPSVYHNNLKFNKNEFHSLQQIPKLRRSNWKVNSRSAHNLNIFMCTKCQVYD